MTAARRPVSLSVRLLALALLIVGGLAGAAPASAGLGPSGVLVQAPRVEDPVAQVRAVHEAFDLLMDRFVHPLDSAVLLDAAWDHLAAEAERRGAPPPGERPTFVGERGTDIATLEAALAAYLTRHPALPSSFQPAYAAIRGMAVAVDEGHTQFLDPRQYQDHLAWARGDVRYGGVGARMRGPGLIVSEVFRDSPAERAGLRVGDEILEVDGVSVEGMTLDQTVGMVRGPAGTVVVLRVRRPSEAAPRTLRVTREEISFAFVTHQVMDDVGYLQLRGFTEPGVVEDFHRAMAEFQSLGLRGVVLDLRGNSGGYIHVGTRLLSNFLPAGSGLFRQLDRAGQQQTFASRDRIRYELPLVILVDSNTASMGEIFAAAMQEHGAATILGTRTAGNVAAGQVFALSDGSAMQVTVMEILTGNGRPLNRVGVEPDEVIESEGISTPEQDTVLARALELLRAEGNLPSARRAA